MSAPCSPDCPGLGVFNEDVEPPDFLVGFVEVQRCDDCDRYTSDYDAAVTVCGSCAVVEVDGYARVYVSRGDARRAGLAMENDR